MLISRNISGFLHCFFNPRRGAPFETRSTTNTGAHVTLAREYPSVVPMAVVTCVCACVCGCRESRLDFHARARAPPVSHIKNVPDLQSSCFFFFFYVPYTHRRRNENVNNKRTTRRINLRTGKGRYGHAAIGKSRDFFDIRGRRVLATCSAGRSRLVVVVGTTTLCQVVGIQVLVVRACRTGIRACRSSLPRRRYADGARFVVVPPHSTTVDGPREFPSLSAGAP